MSISEPGKTFVEPRELAEELKRAGVMREGCRLDSVDEVLEGLSRLSDRMADTFDQPMSASVGSGFSASNAAADMRSLMTILG